MSVVLEAWRNGLRPDPQIDVVEWSQKYRYLSSDGSARHGKFDINLVPYTIEIAREMSPTSPTQEVYVCKGVQMAITEMANNILFCYAHLYPRPMLSVFPTKPLLTDHVESKAWSGINASPVLRDKVFKPIKQGATDSSSTLRMKFNGGSIRWKWSESKSTYASVTYGLVHASDIDRFPDNVEGEGDPTALLKKRLDTFGERRKFLAESSPTKKRKSKIHSEAINGDQNYYYMHCPSCNEYIKFEKEHFLYSYDEETYELIGDVEYGCYKCGSLIKEHEKFTMMAIENGAKYIPANPNYRNKLRKTYFLPAYYSPFKTWIECFREYLEALKDKDLYGKIEKIKVWYNTVDGSVFDDESEKEVETTIDQLLHRREEYKKVPSNVVLLSAGVDTQSNRYEVSVYGWVNEREKYLIAHYIVAGDPKDTKTQKRLDSLLFNKFFSTEEGGEMKIFCSAIDTGGEGKNTQAVYSYVLKRYKKHRLFAVKGGKSLDDPLVKDYSVVKTKRKKPLKLYILGVNSAKDDWISDIEERFETRYLHLPHDIQHFYDGVTMEHDMSDKAFLQQFLEETQDEDGRWKNEHSRRNEALDCAVYATAAVKCVKGLDLDRLEEHGKKAYYRKTAQ